MHKVIYAARAQPLFCLLNRPFVGCVLVAVAIMFFLGSLLAHQEGMK